MSEFRPIDRDTAYLLPPSVQDWLPEEHLARFVVDIVDRLDLSAITGQYAGRGSDAYHPALLLGLLIYGYATGVYSSRRIERATHDSVAFRFIAADQHPDHDTLSTFRKRHLHALQGLFVQVLVLAKEMKVLKLGKLSLDGTKVQANASKHSALSYGHACQQEERLRAEVAELFRLAEDADASEIPDGMNLPAELARREARLKAIEEAKTKIEARAQARHEEERAEYERKVAQREHERQTGQKPRGRDPQPPQAGPKDSDQINLTDEESRILPGSGGGFVQGYNAQAAVDMDSLLVIGQHVTPAANDKQQVEPMLDRIKTLPQALGQVDTLVTDNGFYSAANVQACVDAKIEPLMALRREAHHRSLWGTDLAAPADASAPAVDRMRARLDSKDGRALYARRKCTVEPVFGIIKAAMCFRQFLLRGLDQVNGEWNLVTMAWNIKRMFVLNAARAQPA